MYRMFAKFEIRGWISILFAKFYRCRDVPNGSPSQRLHRFGSGGMHSSFPSLQLQIILLLPLSNFPRVPDRRTLVPSDTVTTRCTPAQPRTLSYQRGFYYEASTFHPPSVPPRRSWLLHLHRSGHQLLPITRIIVLITKVCYC